MRISKEENPVPIWKKAYLTLEEAAKYTGIGINKLREVSDQPGSDFTLWVGNRRLLNRKKLEEYLDKQGSL